MKRIGLVTTEPIKLIVTVLKALEGEVYLSLEGPIDFADLEIFTSKLDDFMLLKRNSAESAMEFRVFRLNDDTKEAFIGLLEEHQSRENELVHVEIEWMGKIVFSAIDNFAYDCVFLDEDIGRQIIPELLENGFVSQIYEPPNYPQHPFLVEYIAENPHLAEVFEE